MHVPSPTPVAHSKKILRCPSPKPDLTRRRPKWLAKRAYSWTDITLREPSRMGRRTRSECNQQPLSCQRNRQTSLQPQSTSPSSARSRPSRCRCSPASTRSFLRNLGMTLSARAGCARLPSPWFAAERSLYHKLLDTIDLENFLPRPEPAFKSPDGPFASVHGPRARRASGAPRARRSDNHSQGRAPNANSLRLISPSSKF